MRFGYPSHTHNMIGSSAVSQLLEPTSSVWGPVGVKMLLPAKVPLEGMVGHSRVTWMAQLAIHADGPKHDGPKI